MIKSLIGFAVGALSTFALLNWPGNEPDTQSDNISSDSSYEPFIRKEHESFRLSGLILLNVAESSKDDDHYGPGVMRLEHKTKLSNIGPDDILHVCFTQSSYNSPPIEGQYVDLELGVYFKNEFRTRLMSQLENNPDQHLTLEYLDYTLSHIWPQADVTQFAIDYYASRPNHDLIPGLYDLELSGLDNKFHGLMRVAHYLSPNAVPIGCEETFNSSHYEWWQAIVDELWDNSPLSREQQIEEIVNEAFRTPKS